MDPEYGWAAVCANLWYELAHKSLEWSTGDRLVSGCPVPHSPGSFDRHLDNDPGGQLAAGPRADRDHEGHPAHPIHEWTDRPRLTLWHVRLLGYERNPLLGPKRHRPQQAQRRRPRHVGDGPPSKGGVRAGSQAPRTVESATRRRGGREAAQSRGERKDPKGKEREGKGQGSGVGGKLEGRGEEESGGGREQGCRANGCRT